jgi:hypothetical protein
MARTQTKEPRFLTIIGQESEDNGTNKISSERIEAIIRIVRAGKIATKEGMMARKSRLTRVAVGIGKAMGRADRKAHQMAKAGLVAKQELEEIAKQVEGLKRQLQKTTKRLKHALR